MQSALASSVRQRPLPGTTTLVIVVLIFVFSLSSLAIGHGLDGTAIAVVLAATTALVRSVSVQARK